VLLAMMAAFVLMVGVVHWHACVLMVGADHWHAFVLMVRRPYR
jgi:hypothetical protein